MKRRLLVALAALAALTLTFAAGRWTAPRSLKTVSVDRETDVQSHNYVGTTDRAVRVETRVQTVWRTRTEKRPDGTVVTVQTAQQGAATDAAAESKTTEVVHDVQYKTVEVIRYRETRSGPDWLLSARVGSGLDDLRPSYGVEAQRRILGPIWAGAWLQGTALRRDALAGGVSVGVGF